MASTRDVPDAIAEPVGRLARNINAGAPTAEALLAFAADMRDGTADFATQALIASANRRGQGLADTLQNLAKAVGQQVETEQAIDTDRARIRATVRTLVVIAMAIFIGLPLLEHDFLAPYRSGSGQVVLGVLLAIAGADLMAARAMARTEPEPRIFGPEAARLPGSQGAEATP